MQEQQENGGFDFDKWAKLAHTDPLAFELERKNILEAVISEAPARNQAQLRRIQWKLDRIRDITPTPLAACVRMQEMMWESVLGSDGLLARLRQLPTTEVTPPAKAEILYFRR
ncbi:MAG: DUF3135 domain-containing protein [Gammaproteobacteria bacterium]